MENQPAPAAPASNSSHKLRNGCIGTIAVIVGLGMLGHFAGGDSGSKAPSAATAPAAPATKVTARQLFDAYQANQLAAAKAYADRALEVSGTIQAIDESMGTPVLQLATSNQFMPVGARFPKGATDQLAAMAKGQKVTVRCAAIEEAGGFLWLNDCAI